MGGNGIIYGLSTDPRLKQDFEHQVDLSAVFWWTCVPFSYFPFLLNLTVGVWTIFCVYYYTKQG